jgi:hypothetical protein
VIGSAPVVQQVQTRSRRRAVAIGLCVVAAGAIGVATWQILERQPETGGVWALAAAVLLVLAGLLVPKGDARARMVLSFADRAFDGAILASVAWVMRTEDPATAAGALIALAAGYLAAYIRARGAALGYLVEESAGTRAIRTGLISAALLAGWTAWAFFVVAIWMLLVAMVRASQVAKEERA